MKMKLIFLLIFLSIMAQNSTSHKDTWGYVRNQNDIVCQENPSLEMLIPFNATQNEIFRSKRNFILLDTKNTSYTCYFSEMKCRNDYGTLIIREVQAYGYISKGDDNQRQNQFFPYPEDVQNKIRSGVIHTYTALGSHWGWTYRINPETMRQKNISSPYYAEREIYAISNVGLSNVPKSKKVQYDENTRIPLLEEKESQAGKWFLNENIKDIFEPYMDREIHVVSIGGPTRAGKSFILSEILEKFKNRDDAIVHFGYFKHSPSDESVTRGMDIALVEYQRQLILIIDCEGLGSSTKEMDPKLVVILSLISQQFIYLSHTFELSFFDDLKMIIDTRNNSIPDYKNAPLDTIYTVLNNISLPEEERMENFIEEFDTDLHDLLKESFEKQYVLFIDEKNNPESLFENDLDNLFKSITNKIKPLKLKNAKSTMKVKLFLSYLEENILEKINQNGKISFGSAIQDTYVKFAENIIQELEEIHNLPHLLKPFNHYVQQYKINKKCSEIDRVYQNFKQQIKDYSEYVKDVDRRFYNKLDLAKTELDTSNYHKGWEIKSTRYEYHTGSPYYTNTVSDYEYVFLFFWRNFKIDTTKNWDVEKREIVTYYNNKTDRGSWTWHKTNKQHGRYNKRY